jgi:hypothetical protein
MMSPKGEEAIREDKAKKGRHPRTRITTETDLTVITVELESD